MPLGIVDSSSFYKSLRDAKGNQYERLRVYLILGYQYIVVKS